MIVTLPTRDTVSWLRRAGELGHSGSMRLVRTAESVWAKRTKRRGATMSRLATDTTIHRAMREFVIALNRAENAQAKGSEAHLLGDLHNAVREAGIVVEETLTASGWAAPGHMIRLPQPDVVNEPSVVINDTGVTLEY
jgi:hypothetical protein